MNIKCSILFLSLYLLELIMSQNNRGKEHTSNDYLNIEVNRTIDLSNSIMHITSRILIKSLKVDPIFLYRFPILKNSTKYLINVGAKLKSSSGDDEVLNLKVTKQSLPADNIFDYYEVNFKSEPMNYEEERILIINEDYYERLSLLPRKISIKEDQLVVLTDSVNHISFYHTKTHNIAVYLPHERTEIIEYTQKNAIRIKDKIIYILDEPMTPLQIEPFKIHYVFNEPITIFNYAIRTYEVSHWSNIAVEDKYQVENIGAKLEGEFGRVDYDDYGRFGGKNAIRKMRARLPIKSFGLWYRDEIGNVSTSKAAREWNDVRLDLTPRFPILGGWKSNFFIGYNLPSKFQVSTNGKDLYTLNVTYGLPYEDTLAKNYTVRVVLPEGSQDIKVNLPIESKFQITYEKSFSYLDMFGRPTVVINMKDCYDIHKVDLTIQYSYSHLNLLFKPFLMILFFLAIFMMMIIYFRIDLSLSKKKTE